MNEAVTYTLCEMVMHNLRFLDHFRVFTTFATKMLVCIFFIYLSCSLGVSLGIGYRMEGNTFHGKCARLVPDTLPNSRSHFWPMYDFTHGISLRTGKKQYGYTKVMAFG